MATWAECKVNRAGPAENGVIYIHLREKDGAFNFWFQAVPGMKKEMLATALAALNMQTNVVANLEATTAYSQINRLYVKSQ